MNKPGLGGTDVAPAPGDCAECKPFERKPLWPAKSICKRGQYGDAGAAMLVLMVVLMGVWFWHGGMWRDGERGHMSGPASTATQEKSALDLLDEAYARGDITREEYLRKRDDLLRR